MRSSSEVMKMLGVSKITLYKWANNGKLKARKYTIGTRTFYGFDGEDVKRVKALIIKNPGKGKPKIKGL